MAEHECHTGKVPYRNPGQAVRAMRAISKRDNAKQHVVKPYRCPNCSHWHLGTPDKLTLRTVKHRQLRDPDYSPFA